MRFFCCGYFCFLLLVSVSKSVPHVMLANKHKRNYGRGAITFWKCVVHSVYGMSSLQHV